MAKKKIKTRPEDEPMTYVLTAAQGIQNPQSARMYGHDISKGAPNIPLIKTIENYVELNNAELQIHSVVGGNCNEIELHPYFNTRNDVYVEADSKKRNLQNRVKEEAKRGKYVARKNKWTSNQESKNQKAAKKEKIEFLKEQYGKDWKEHESEADGFETYPVKGGLFPHQLPMHYFWKDIPKTNWPIIGKRFNSNVSTVSIPIKPQNKQPLNGKEFLTKRYGGNSVIIAATKSMMVPVAKGTSNEYPQMLLTTRACTHPNYNFGDQGYMAKEEHRYGFAVVDKLDDKLFLPRIVPAHKNGTFIDLAIKYTKDKEPERAIVSAMDIGDSHFVEINPKVNDANMRMMRYTRPEKTFLNDAFDALSVSVHDIKDPIRLARLHRAGLSGLEQELYLTAEYVSEVGNLAAEWGGTVYMKADNHGDMLYRWLSQEAYRKDKENILTAHKILAQNPSRDNCLETAMKLFYDIPENVKFLDMDEDIFVQGYLMSMHGHKGVNGAKGSLKGIEKVAKKVSIGHGHSLMVWKDSLSAGVSANVMDYQKGYFSTSMAGNNLIYETGLAQAIPIIKGRFAPDRVLDFLEKHQ